MISSITHTIVTFSNTQLHGNQNTIPGKQELVGNSVCTSAVSLEIKYIMLANSFHGDMLLSFYPKAVLSLGIFLVFLFSIAPPPPQRIS